MMRPQTCLFRTRKPQAISM